MEATFDLNGKSFAKNGPSPGASAVHEEPRGVAIIAPPEPEFVATLLGYLFAEMSVLTRRLGQQVQLADAFNK